MIRNICSNWVGLVFNAAVSLFLTPLLIRGLGEFNFGLWALITSVLGYYGLLDCGVKTTLFRFVARFRGRDERCELDITFNTGLAITASICLFIVLSSLVIIPFFPRWLYLNEESRPLFQALALILGPGVAFLFLGRFFGAYLNGCGRFDLFNLAAIITGTLRAVSIVAAIRLGHGLLGVAVAESGAALSLLVVQAWMVLRVDRSLTWHWRLVSISRLHELASFSFYYFLTMLGEAVRLYSVPIVIARILTVAALAPYSIALRLLEYLKEIVSALVGPIMGLMCELDGQGRTERLRALYMDSTRLTMALSCFVGLVFLLDGPFLLRLWLGEEFGAKTYPVLVIMATGYLANVGQHPTLPALVASAKHRPLANLLLIEGVACVVLSVWFGRWWGLAGVAWATSIPILVTRTLVQPKYALRALGVQPMDYLVHAIGRPVLTAVAFLALHYVLGLPDPNTGFLQALLFIPLQLIGYTLLAFVLILKPAESEALVQRLWLLAGRRLSVGA